MDAIGNMETVIGSLANLLFLVGAFLIGIKSNGALRILLLLGSLVGFTTWLVLLLSYGSVSAQEMEPLWYYNFYLVNLFAGLISGVGLVWFAFKH